MGICVSLIPLSIKAETVQEQNKLKGPVSREIFPEQIRGYEPISLYQKFISPVDGDRCYMLPSCSAYMAQAIRERGLVTGFLLGADRITRCGYDLQKYDHVWRGTIKYYVDPPPMKSIK